MTEEQRKGFHPFYIAPLLYIVSVYLFAFMLMQGTDLPFFNSIYVPLVSGVLNIIVSVVFCKPQNRMMMLNAAVLVKFALIPFFVVGGILVFMSFVLSFIPVPFMIFVGPLLGAMGLIVGWAVLAFGSPYVISYLHLSSKAGIRPSGMVALHGIAQFFFTLDVIDVMILAWRERKWRKFIVCMIILTILLIVALIFLLMLGIVGMLI